MGSGFLALNMKKYFLILTSSILISCGEKVDLLVYNAKIYTANDTFDEATSFVVKDGVFIDVGSEGEDLNDRYNPDNVVDAHGLTIIPGLIDAHCHFLQFGLESQQLNLRGTKSFDEILKKLVSYYNESNPKVIYGRYWDQNDWTIKEFPDKKELDSIFPEVPVVLERVDGHAMLVNQKALDIAGINLNTNLPGGTVKKKNGRLTGILIDSPKNLIINSLPKPTTDDKIKALMLAENKCFEYGLTTIDDAGLSKKDILLIDSLQQSDIIKMRIYAMISNNNDDINYFIKRGIYKTDKLNVRSVKVYADGALGSRGALLKEPYSDDPKNKGKYSTPYNSIDSLALKKNT